MHSSSPDSPQPPLNELNQGGAAAAAGGVAVVERQQHRLLLRPGEQALLLQRQQPLFGQPLPQLRGQELALLNREWRRGSRRERGCRDEQQRQKR